MIRPRPTASPRHGGLRLSFSTRPIPKSIWKVLWRQLRIVNRETALAQTDCLAFGTGFLRSGRNVPDFIQRVHPSNVAIRLMEKRP